MTAAELIRVLMEIPNAEIRIGDQTEAGPYLHASVGGAFAGSHGEVILCANDDEEWISETPAAYVEEKDMPELEELWAPPQEKSLE